MAHVRREFFALYESTKLPVAGQAVLRFRNSMTLRRKRGSCRQLNAWPCAKNTPSPSLTVWKSDSKSHWARSQGRPRLPKPSDMRLRACQRYGPISIPAFLSLTTTRPSAQSALWPLDVKTICLWGQRQAVNPPLSPTLSSRPPK